MSSGWAAALFIAALVGAWAVTYRFFGDYLFRVVGSERHIRVERAIYRLVGADADSEQNAGAYTRSVLAFSALSILFLYGLQRLQSHLWLDAGLPGVESHVAWNTAVSFVTNTNWQAYSGESTITHLTQMAGLAVQNFLSAAVGIAVAVALIRGLARHHTDQLGSFWVDLTRLVVRVLLPIAVLGTIVFIAAGMVQNLSAGTEITTLTGGARVVPGGPVASQEIIKELGTNGGGFYNVNSSHPFENPTAWTNWLEIFLLGLIPFSLPRVFGRMVGDKRQGLAIVAAMGLVAVVSVALLNVTELAHPGTVPTAVGASMEGREVRFGTGNSATFAAMTTLTSTGSVDSFHDSYSGLGGGTLMFNMMLGEATPGGVGSGLYGMLVLAILTVFVAGLMVGRTPEYLGKKIGAREIKLASLYFLITPFLVLVGTAFAMASPRQRGAMLNTGTHGYSEVLYAFTSASNNNGSAFAGLTVNTGWYDVALGLCMLLGRFLPIVLVLALAGSFARQTPAPPSAGTMPTHTPLFVSMLIGVTVVLVALTFLPALARGPRAEGLTR
ncbi:MAG TPA: potassium-transporting ATPase subunit KdpA [Propionicimonas sp.]|nr:potassium-transporting ATPase subunit KdpA [Propionicimonas sp.]